MSQQINLNLDKDQYNELKKILNNQYKTYDEQMSLLNSEAPDFKKRQDELLNHQSKVIQLFDFIKRSEVKEKENNIQDNDFTDTIKAVDRMKVLRQIDSLQN